MSSMLFSSILLSSALVPSVLGNSTIHDTNENCTVHSEVQGYYNITDLGRAVLLNATNHEINNLLGIGCDVNSNRTCVDFTINRDHETWLDGYGELTEIISFLQGDSRKLTYLNVLLLGI